MGTKNGKRIQVHQGHVDVDLMLVLLHCTMIMIMIMMSTDTAMPLQTPPPCQGLLTEEERAARADPEGQSTRNARVHRVYGLQRHRILLVRTTVVSLNVAVPRVIQMEG
jgi:hypothetical protein